MGSFVKLMGILAILGLLIIVLQVVFPHFVFVEQFHAFWVFLTTGGSSK